MIWYLSIKQDFSHDENSFSFSYTGVSNRKNPLIPFYRYSLNKNEEDSNWNYTNSRNINYNDLGAGNYVFEAAARNKLGTWSTIPISTEFNIKPHFSNTLGFQILVGAVLVLFGFCIYRWRYKSVLNREREKRKLKEATLSARESQLNVLRNQMNPHFIFNSLNSIQNYIFKNDVENANYYLAKFSKLIRNSLEYSRLDKISLDKEISFIRNYLDLEKMRFPRVFDYNFQIEDDLPIREFLVPALLFQPILENSVRHAFKEIEYLGKIEIFICLENESDLSVIIRDNGPGFSLKKKRLSSSKEKHESISLQVVKERIELLNINKSTTKASFILKNLTGELGGTKGTEAKFILPQNQYS